MGGVIEDFACGCCGDDTTGVRKIKIGWKCWLKKPCHEERHGQKHLGRRGNPVAIQGGHALAKRSPRYACNDVIVSC
jgi:hypothetical protein